MSDTFIHVFKISWCFHVGPQVEPEDVAVWELWPVVPRGLHTVSNQAITVWRQVRYWALLQKALDSLHSELSFCLYNKGIYLVGIWCSGEYVQVHTT